MRMRPIRLLRQLAREMRHCPTPAERIAWECFRARRCLGLRFKRQVVIEGVIVDFYCRASRLAVELDGAPHFTPGGRARDRARDAHLAARGITVLHIRNEEIAPARLHAAIRELLLRPPSPLAGEGDRG